MWTFGADKMYVIQGYLSWNFVLSESPLTSENYRSWHERSKRGFHPSENNVNALKSLRSYNLVQIVCICSCGCYPERWLGSRLTSSFWDELITRYLGRGKNTQQSICACAPTVFVHGLCLIARVLHIFPMGYNREICKVICLRGQCVNRLQQCCGLGQDVVFITGVAEVTTSTDFAWL